MKEKASNDISIMDVTVRDGSYAIGYQYTPDRVSDIVTSLDEAGIDYAEVNHGCGLGACRLPGLQAAASDLEYIRAAKRVAKRIRVGAIAGPERVTKTHDIDEIIHEVDFIRFAANSNDPLTVKANIELARGLRADLPIFFQLMRSSRIPRFDLIESAKKVEEMGVDTLYIVDTAGHFSPDEIGELVSDLKSQVGMEIGFHGHNNLDLAVANSLAAVKAGATFVDASLKGMGRGAGNAQMGPLISLLKRMGFAASIDLEELLYAAEEFISPIMPPRFGIDSIEIITGDKNIDLYPLDFYRRISDVGKIDLIDLIYKMASDKKIVEIDRPGISRALKGLDRDASKIFDSLEGRTVAAESKAKLPPIRKGMDHVVLFALGTPIKGMDLPATILDKLSDEFRSTDFRLIPFDQKNIEYIEKAEVLFSYTITPDILKQATSLKWFHSVITGPDIYTFPELVESKIHVTSPRGVYSNPVAETVIGLMLSLSRKIATSIHMQDERSFDAATIISEHPPSRELSGSNALIIGMGGIGEAVAKRCRGMEMNVTGVVQKKTDNLHHANKVIELCDLGSAIEKADFIILSCPLTNKTRGMFTAKEFAIMKSTACIINIARGELTDELALAAALVNGDIGGAAADVFSVEPLPSTHPLYGAPNMIITPHISGWSTHFWERAVARFRENYKRHLEGKNLIGEVDFRRGY